ncbi:MULTISPECIES: DMT family transporter [Bacillaceae]|uniref:DMT family transporter n=1 Tax=Bacillaceae TaxID=186817 RepID=UPI001E3CD426|nr:MULTISPECIES: DMT family transporter [Bacillaceae]MCE4050429.1 DMT family transporter [Bacillus sp. Au-Bac7]MCM3030450.1 DMT family transporter [Niallia sp. MER 6]MDL0434626.1 DMT family transporter [Niallia sp. SS-2023]UPO88410.1 DMT family transporter [Niallia sp. Man26]
MEQTTGTKSIAIPLAISIIAISFSAIFVKWSDAPATILSMYRMWLAGILMLPMVYINRKEFKKLSKKDWWFLLFSGAFLALHFALWFGSLKLTTVASSTIILALQPLVSLAGGFLLYRERTTSSAIMTMGIAIIGAMMIGWGDIGLSKASLLGDLLSFLSVIAVVGYLLIGQSIVKKVSHWVYTSTVFLFAAMLLTIFNLSSGEAFTGYPPKEWGIFLLLAIVPSLSHVINNWLLNYVNATTISMSILGEPVGATILAVILLNERLSGSQIAGGLLVLAGVFYFLLQQQKPKPVQHEKTI